MPWLLSLAAVTLLGLILRLVYLKGFTELPFFDHPVGDSAIYLARAREIAQGNWLPSAPFFYGSIFYPYFLAASLSISHSAITMVCVVQVLAGAAFVATVGLLGRMAYGNAAGLAAALLAALYGPLAFLEADLLGIVWGMLALALGIFFLLGWWSRQEVGHVPSSLWLFGAGLCFGIAATERPNLILLVPLVAVWVVACASRKRVRAAVALLVAAAVPLAIVAALNVAGTGQWVPLTTSFGINLSIGYHPGADGTFREPWSAEDPEFSARETDLERASVVMASRRVGRPLTAQEASSYWGRTALSYMLRNPWDAARLTARKLLLVLNNAELTNHLNFSFMRSQLPALRWMPLTFVVVFVLGVFGFTWSLVARHRLPVTVFFVLVAAGAMGSVAPFFVADRYRIPLVLPLLVGGGYGLSVLIGMIRERTQVRGRQLVWPVIGAACALVIALLPLERSLVGRDYWMLAEGWQAEGNLDAAIRAYNTGLEKAGEDGAMLNNLSRAYLQRGDRKMAIATLRRAIVAEPTLALPYKNLGKILIDSGDFRGAFDALSASLRYNPGDAEAWGALAALLAEGGDHAGAARAFARARELAPHDKKLMELMSRYERRDK